MNTGGPAFPLHTHDWHKEVSDTGYIDHDFTMGMTLRDYFAGQALIATFKNSVKLFNGGGFPDDADLDVIYSDAAETAYLVADEMLKARKK